jgi:hypothetical protein
MAWGISTVRSRLILHLVPRLFIWLTIGRPLTGTIHTIYSLSLTLDVLKAVAEKIRMCVEWEDIYNLEGTNKLLHTKRGFVDRIMSPWKHTTEEHFK